MLDVIDERGIIGELALADAAAGSQEAFAVNEAVDGHDTATDAWESRHSRDFKIKEGIVIA